MNKLKILFLVFSMMGVLPAMAHVSLKSPKGGETFAPGETVKIEWEETIAHDTKNWDLYFSSDGGKTYEALRLDINVKSLTYDWIVPSTATKEARIKVVQDNSGGDYSDESGNFTIAGTSTASENALLDLDIALFPNPASDVVHIKIPQSTPRIKRWWVHDKAGRQMSLKIPVIQDVQDQDQYQLDILQWPAGIYYMVIQIGNGVVVREFIKQ